MTYLDYVSLAATCCIVGMCWTWGAARDVEATVCVEWCLLSCTCLQLGLFAVTESKAYYTLLGRHVTRWEALSWAVLVVWGVRRPWFNRLLYNLATNNKPPAFPKQLQTYSFACFLRSEVPQRLKLCCHISAWLHKLMAKWWKSLE